MTTAVRTEPDTIRQARERIERLEAMIAEARQAIETAKTEIETAKAKRETAKARGDHSALWSIDQALLDAEAAIAQREMQIRRLTPEREALPGILIDWDQRAHEADRLAEEIEGTERLAALNAEYRVLAAKCEEYREWSDRHGGAPGVHSFPWLKEVHRTGQGRDFDWQIALAVKCFPQKRERLAEIERSLRA